ncbi:hypothetical protein J0910_26770 [Nocardiopsis sp. CNT-189]|uniref:hypothetical protein n=1 Tax=Nocardiopsis oceanisediminis TaxID=2816862 RepID=UPI003B29EB8E
MRDNLIDPGFFSGDNSWGGAASDRAQNEAIRDLNAELSSARRRLNSELKHIRGTLEQRIDRISASFDAFVELSDVRERLSLFTPYARVRYRVLALLDGADRDLPEPARADEPDYWLAPCARGLRALLDGDTAGAQRHFFDGAELDPLRAGVFALLASAVKAPESAPALAEWILPGVLPELPGEQAAYQRAVLLLAVEGRLGEAATGRALAVCAERLRADGGAEAAAEQVFLGADRDLKAPAPPKGVEPEGALGEVLAAARRLAAIRARLEEAGGAPAPSPPSEGEDESGSDPAVPAELAEADRVLRLLVAEGGRPEAELLRRAAQLRAVVESGGSAGSETPVASWKDIVGSASEEVRGICSEAGPSPARSAFTRRLLAAELRAAAEACARQALAPLPDRAVVRHQGGRVDIGPQGADPEDLAAGERRAAEAYQGAGGSRALPITIACGGAIFAVGALLSGEMSLWAFAVGGFLVGGLLHLSENKKRDEARSSAEAEGARFRAKVEESASAWRDHLARAEETRSRAAGDIDAVRRLLASG